MILNEFGYPIQTINKRFIDGVAGSPAHPQLPTLNQDINRLIIPFERQNLQSTGRRLYANMGFVKGIVDDRTQGAIGTAFTPVFAGCDSDWGHIAQAWLHDEFLPFCEIRNDWHTFLFLLSTNIDHSGDCGVLFTQDLNGMPRVQLIPPHRIGFRGDQNGVFSYGGIYENLKADSGVVFNEINQPVGYSVLGNTEDKDEFYTSDQMNLVFDPHFINQTRGYPAIMHGIPQLRTVLTSGQWEEFAAMICSSIGVLETTPSGLPEDNDGLGVEFVDVAQENRNMLIQEQSEGIKFENVYGGMIKYLKAGTGSKLEAFVNNRPGVDWESHMDRLLRTVAAGIGYPVELAWQFKGMSGPAVRAVQGKARRAIADRQMLLKPVAKKIVCYAIAKAMKLGILPFNADWYKWSFNMPPLFSIDEGRDMQQRRNDYLMGFTTMSDILAAEGRGSYRQHIRQLAVEAAIRTQEREAVEKEYGVKIDPTEIQLRSINQIAAAKPGAEDDAAEEDDDAEAGKKKCADGSKNYDNDTTED